MIPDKMIRFLGLLIVLSIFGACSEFLSDSDAPGSVDWDTGPEIIPADDRHLSEAKRAKYLEDAEKLAIRYVNGRDSTRMEIPDKLINKLYDGLIHIVNSGHPKAREATERYPVHARIPPGSRKIIVYADTTASWIDAWRNDQTETGNQEVDELISQFNFTLVQYRELEHVLSNSAATLKSDRAINVYTVGKLFQELEDIEHAGSDGITDGSEIEVHFFNNHLRYTFEYGFGDCPAGCINRHIWRFNVYGDGTVEFAGEKGPLPNS